MSVCIFFGHRDCYGLDKSVLQNAIEAQIKQGADKFLVGHQGLFDRMVHSCLKNCNGSICMFDTVLYWRICLWEGVSMEIIRILYSQRG